MRMLNKVVMRRPADLVPLVGNPNQESDPEFGKLKASLLRHGLLENLVLQEGTDVVVGGNHRLLAVKELIATGDLPADTKVPCGSFPFSEDELKRAAVALNRIGGDFNAAMLRDFLDGVDFSGEQDLLATGLSGDDLRFVLETPWGAEDVLGHGFDAFVNPGGPAQPPTPKPMPE